MNHVLLNNEFIKRYLEEDNEEIQAMAYYHRDLELGISCETAFNYATNKLCISPEGRDSLINVLFKMEYRIITKNQNQNQNFSNIELNNIYNNNKYTDDFINQKNMFINENRNMILKLTERYENLLYYQYNHLKFYQELTKTELDDLGF